MPTKTLYFQFNPTENSVSLYSDRAQRHGGMLPPGEGCHGIGFEAFKKACAGKIVETDGSFVIKPAGRLSVAAPA